MSKLPQAHRFTDLSDYGRKPAQYIVGFLKDTSATPVQVTLLFFVSGMIAIYCIYTEYYILAAIFMILKSILDGELNIPNDLTETIRTKANELGIDVNDIRKRLH